MKTEYIAIILMVIIAVGLLYYGFVTFIKSKQLKTTVESSIDINKLIQALGGKDNIEDITSSPSKLTVILSNQKDIDVVSIQELGASGIVEGKNNVSMIFGKQSPQIEKDLKDLLK